MFSKILVPLDGSPLAEEALPHACKLARVLKAQLVLLCIGDETSISTDKIPDELEALSVARDYLTKVKKQISEQNHLIDPAQVGTLAIYGNSKNVVELADKISGEKSELVAAEHADLIVMATHGRSGLSRLVMGSVATSLLKHTHTPVILVRPSDKHAHAVTTHHTTGSLDKQTVMMILLDGTDDAEQALEPAIELAQKLDAIIELFEVIPPYFPSTYGVVDQNYYIKDDTIEREVEAITYLKKIEKKITSRGIACTMITRIGNPAEEILSEIENLKAGMIVTTTKAPSLLGRDFLGSVADEVLRNSHLPVMVINVNEALTAGISETIGKDAA